MNKQKFCLQCLDVIMDDNSIVKCQIWQDEFDFWRIKYFYPRCEKRFFYSMVNQIDEIFEEQYPYWANKLRYQ